ncbi:MAG: hypothetical protein JST68_07105 [Bacteroidetes bacterium]|nr:hypothetical protein [Bacteroidota bacterium]
MVGRAQQIRWAFREAAVHKAGFHVIEIVAPETEIIERLKNPRPDSEADLSVYRLLKEMWEPILEDHLVLKSAPGNIEVMLQTALDYVQGGRQEI